ncbi:LysR family transcriptional regulator [Pseudorhodoplanes sp.]|uniref:LysR family transcriptional regulator n=1 Tax=Pseudorhodoplanes sp. TaxID=1934341 RepID=UPI003D0AE855
MRDIDMLDLNLLRVFEAIMREENVSLAAAQLHLTQPAVSNALNRLRAAFNDELFVRTRQGMEPTPVARALRDPVRRGLASIRSALSENLAFDPARSDRRFTILTTDVVELCYGAHWLRLFSREAPTISLKLMEACRSEYEKLLDSGQADLAFGHFKISDSFRSERIGRCNYVAMLCAKYAKKLGIEQGGQFPLNPYLRAAHVDVVPRAVVESPIARAFRDNAPFRRVALTVAHVSVLPSMIPDTEIVATVPQPAIPALCKSGAVTWANLPFETEMTSVFIAWHRRQDADQGHIWMREKLRSIRAPFVKHDSVPTVATAQRS